jgi:hypothetical protein
MPEAARKCVGTALEYIIPRDRVIGYLCSIKAEDKDKTYLNKLFKASELVYTIVTEGRNKHNAVGIVWTVRRKYSDFDWLKTILGKLYPGLIVPPLPV